MSLRISNSFIPQAGFDKFAPQQPVPNDGEPLLSPQGNDADDNVGGLAALSNSDKNKLSNKLNLLNQLNMLGDINADFVKKSQKIDINALNYRELCNQGLSNDIIQQYFVKVKTPMGTKYELNPKYDGYDCKAKTGTHNGKNYSHIFTAWTIQPDCSRREVVHYIYNNYNEYSKY